jgi:hypothetical protein
VVAGDIRRGRPPAGVVVGVAEPKLAASVPSDFSSDDQLPLPGAVPTGTDELTFTVHMSEGSGPTSPVTLPAQPR